MRPQGSAAELERRRKRAIRLLRSGQGIREVARIIGCSSGAVCYWRDLWQEGGLKALAPQKPPPRQHKVSASQCQQLAILLKQGAQAQGYRNELWTLKRIREVIRKQFQVSISQTQAWRIVRRLGFTPQKPLRRAKQRDEPAIEHWKRSDWPALKKRPVGRTDA